MRNLLFLTAILAFGPNLQPVFAQPVVSQKAEAQEQLAREAKTLVILLNGRDQGFGISLSGNEFVWNARNGFFGAHEWFEWWQTSGDELAFIALENPQVSGEFPNLRAETTIRYARKPHPVPVIAEGETEPKMEVPPFEKWPTQSETLSWRWDEKGKRWKAEPSEPSTREYFFSAPLRWTVFSVAQSDGALEKFRTQLAQHRLKSAALGILQFVQDYDGRLAFAPEFLSLAIAPYVKNPSVFLRPGTQKPFGFNEFLSGQIHWEISKPAETVLLYEGEWGQLDFGERGTAAVCFADGHVELVDEKRAKTLIWKP